MVIDPLWRSWRGLKLIIKGVLHYHCFSGDLLWSRGWFRIADWAGNSNLIYPLYPTRYRTLSLKALRNKQGIIWLRMGSNPEKPEIATGASGDINLFARDVVGSLGGPVVLVTTDGDLNVPSDLPAETVTKILSDPLIKAWFTQNLDAPRFHSKLKSIPIGLDLHTPIRKWGNPRGKEKMFRKAIRKAKELCDRTFRIWSDVHLESALGEMLDEFPEEHGKPGAVLFKSRLELREAINSGRLESIVDVPEHRLPLAEIWDHYGKYFFVFSLPGHGLDCHRTWEALALGATVITIHSPLDALLRPYRVVFLDRCESNQEWWQPLLSKEWVEQAAQNVQSRDIPDLSWSRSIVPMKNSIDSIERDRSN